MTPSSTSSAPHHPEGAVPLADVVRDHAHLDAGDLGELTGTQDAEALHPLDTELLSRSFRARHVCTRRDRKDDGLGSTAWISATSSMSARTRSTIGISAPRSQ